MQEIGNLFDSQTQKLFEHSEELFARSRVLMEQGAIQSELLKDLTDQSEKVIQSMRNNIDEINKKKLKNLQ